MKRITLKVIGMHCKSCEMLITDALMGVGAKECKADSKTGTVVIEFNEKKLSPQKIEALIQQESYKVE
ncbi:heavy-metal-associated domain-containing protein [Candidatus Woesearchaeota archaeon]|nr:heavy-metal-associated domain-containing protein [Candidatus Woesearchaeota archaeon]